MDVKEAYKLLELPENSTMDEVEKQYMTWIKRDRALQGVPNDEKPFDMAKITDAYNTIKQINVYGSITKEEDKTFKDKLQHFLHYHKLHIAGAIILLILVGSFIQTFVNNYQEKKELASLPPEDLGIMLYGDYFSLGSDVSPVSENVLSIFPSWERVTTNSSYAPTEVNDTMDAGNQQKSVITLMQDQSDVYIVGEENFEQLVQLELFQPLESSIKDQVSEDHLIYGKSPEDETEQIYGVVIDNQSLFKGVEVKENKRIAAIRVDADKKDNALKLMTELTK
ncbi:J domain-containing protein [Metabacillus schmidteae]|uniref:J domain-containing protein n=1 Tax=Metabacillus schmidteae TaxID=2730405 RepID=UPI00158B9C69|nr:hypothetical protein [Metabacillus schmidteae]